ncbi:hypothetical protein HMPREF9137_0986 [Prevotella denticola F0289]|nr:hypothetical protein HMPREF9137_0986 [Prevotella denticola F0289]
MSRLLSRQNSGRSKRHLVFWHHLRGCRQHCHCRGKSCN